jgi:hypothetical protein
MPGSWIWHHHPFLTDDNCSLTSEVSRKYNCIAWAAGSNRLFWWPDQWEIGYWPPNVRREETMDAFKEAFRTIGYEVCPDGLLESSIEKIAIFGINKQGNVIVPTHATRQLKSGKWTSKMGPLEDISHDDESDVRGPIYGQVVFYMSRLRS